VPESNIPYWIETFQKYYDLFGGGLISHHGFTPVDVGVYVFLITQRWFSEKTGFSSYGIVTALGALPAHLPKKHRISYSEKTVSASLKKLATLGFVRRCSNPARKGAGGSPAKAFYETVKIIDLEKFIQKQLDAHRDNAMGIISRLSDIEESLDLKDVGAKGEKR